MTLPPQVVDWDKNSLHVVETALRCFESTTMSRRKA